MRILAWLLIRAVAAVRFTEYCGSAVGSPPFAPPGMTLSSVVRVARHGARSPVAWLPNLVASPPWSCEAFFSMGVNGSSSPVHPTNDCGGDARALLPSAQQLTEQGARQHRRLGADLRQRCPAGSGLRARAASIERTLVSAQQECVGFGDPSCSLHTEYFYEYDMLGYPTAQVCPAYAAAYESFFQLPEVASIVKNANGLLVKLEAMLNASSPMTRSLVAATDALVVSRCAGKALNVPDDLTDQLFLTGCSWRSCCTTMHLSDGFCAVALCLPP